MAGDWAGRARASCVFDEMREDEVGAGGELCL
jgi:hypothetical protein